MVGFRCVIPAGCARSVAERQVCQPSQPSSTRLPSQLQNCGSHRERRHLLMANRLQAAPGRGSPPPSKEDRSALKAELLELLGDGADGQARMARVADRRRRLEETVQALCNANPTPNVVRSPLLLGRWQLLTTFKPGTADVNFFSLESWRKYVLEQGPSPVQSLVLGNTNSVAGISQLLEDPGVEGSKWQNVVAFGEGNQLVIEADLEGIRDHESFFYRFSGGFFKLKGGARLPYPVPFGMLEAVRPGQTKGWFSTPYLDEDLRISVGNKGSIFVLRRPPGDDNAMTEPLVVSSFAEIITARGRTDTANQTWFLTWDGTGGWRNAYAWS